MAPPDDGRDGDAGEVFTHAFFLIAGICLLPRQWVASGLAAAIALGLALSRRARVRSHS